MAQPSWVILGAKLRLSAQQDADLSFELSTPPRVSVLTVPPRVSPIDGRPWVVSADPASGLLLLCAPPPPLPPTPPPPGNGALVLNITDIERRPPAYFICDVSSGSAFRIPEPGNGDPTGFPPVINPFNVGIVAAPRNGEGASRYMVVEFRYMFGDEDAMLLCFSSDTGEWVWKPVHNPMLAARWIWGRGGVIAHDGKLWWLDPAGGLIFCDPFAEAPVLDIVPFPDAGPGAGKSLAYLRFVQVSAGKLRCVEWISFMTVCMWTLNDPETKEWALEYEVSFQEIWADDSYKAAGLSMKDPTFALVHPMDPDVRGILLPGGAAVRRGHAEP
jgi:hypothetical protein